LKKIFAFTAAAATLTAGLAFASPAIAQGGKGVDYLAEPSVVAKYQRKIVGDSDYGPQYAESKARENMGHQFAGQVPLSCIETEIDSTNHGLQGGNYYDFITVITAYCFDPKKESIQKVEFNGLKGGRAARTQEFVELSKSIGCVPLASHWYERINIFEAVAYQVCA
jgi:hypothetical protein